MRRSRGHIRIHFLPARVANKKTSQREVELESSEARAHAATIAHRRRGEERGRSLPKHPCKTSCCACNDGSIQSLGGSPTVHNTLPGIRQLIDNGNTGTLDPFIDLATDLSRHDRDLVHFYLTAVPNKLYGVSSRPYFCPVRDCSVPQLARNKIFVRWIAFVAETMIMSSGGMDPHVGKAAIAARRAANYGHMRSMIADTNNWGRDSTVFSLVISAIAEARSGDAMLAKKHLKIAVELLRRRKGLMTIQTMEFTEGMIILNAFVSIELPLFERRSDVEEALERWQNTIATLRKNKIQAAIPQGLRIYFGTQLGLQWGPQIANFHVLACILSSTEREKGEEYLDRVESMIRGSQGAGLLSPLAVLFMLCSCAATMGWWEVQQKGSLRSWETIEIVALMNLAPKARTAVILFLASIISGRAGKELDSEETRDEILENWGLLRSS